MRRVAPLALAFVLALTGAPSSAQDRQLTASEAAALAIAAIDDDEALAALRATTTVDGRPVDLDAATAQLAGAREERLRSLARSFDDAPAVAAEAEVGEAQAMAEAVLDDDKFREQQLPRPFKGVLEWMADRVRPVGDLFAPLGDAIAAVPGGRLIFGVGLGVAAGLGLWAALRRRGRAAVSAPAGWGLVDPAVDPATLEGLADDAEAEGDLEAGLRLRYQAGLVRLAAADRIALRPDTTASLVARQLDDPAMDRLTEAFEQVAYGGRPVEPADLDAARSAWAELLGVRARR